jgi:hypothetical protein
MHHLQHPRHHHRFYPWPLAVFSVGVEVVEGHGTPDCVRTPVAFHDETLQMASRLNEGAEDRVPKRLLLDVPSVEGRTHDWVASLQVLGRPTPELSGRSPTGQSHRPCLGAAGSPLSQPPPARDPPLAPFLERPQRLPPPQLTPAETRTQNICSYTAQSTNRHGPKY